jgi:multidrug efflux pump subunit AcrA (membrane-fusion protein)
MVAADVLTPSMRDRHENDRWIAVKIGHSIENASKLAVGPKHMLVKLIILLVIGTALFITFFKPMYHVDAGFTLTAMNKQVVSAPFDGELQQVFFKPGQTVTKGAVLAKMNIEPLNDKMYKARKDADAAWGHYRMDIASSDKEKRDQAEVDKREAEAGDADIQLIQHQINQAVLKAPFDGIVIRGDLDDKQGASVKLGDVLFEIAPTGNALRAELAVNERDIQDLIEPRDLSDARRQNGTLAVNTFTDQKFNFRIERIVPQGEAKEGDNVFKVYAVIDNPAPWMRPGMQGDAKINVAPRRVVWIWTHRLVDLMRLKLWM